MLSAIQNPNSLPTGRQAQSSILAPDPCRSPCKSHLKLIEFKENLRDYRLYLDDIIDSLKKIEDYTDGLEFAEFRDDQKTIDAVIRNFTVLGEAANPPGNYRQISKHSMEANGRNERQACT